MNGFQSAVTIDNNFVKIVMQNSHLGYVSLSNGLRIQVLPDLSFLPKCQKHQCAAFIADRKQLIVWDDDPRNVLARVSTILDDLMESIWNNNYPSSTAPEDEKKNAMVAEGEVASIDGQSETGTSPEVKRRVVLWLPFQVGLSLTLTILVMGLAVSRLVKQSWIDHTYIRFAIVLSIPAQIWLCLVSPSFSTSLKYTDRFKPVLLPMYRQCGPATPRSCQPSQAKHKNLLRTPTYPLTA